MTRRNLDSPSSIVRIGVTFRTPDDDASRSPNPHDIKSALHALRRAGFTVSNVGRATASLRGTRKQYEALTKTQLRTAEVDKAFVLADSGDDHALEGPIAALVQDVSIQAPFVMPGFDLPDVAKVSKIKNITAPQILPSHDPPKPNFHHLEPHQIAELLSATPVHSAGHRGKGIRIVIIDSGFADHPYYAHRGFVINKFAAGSATNIDMDPHGHGTGIVANLFAVAPEATVFGVKLGSPDPSKPGASLLEGFLTAMALEPHIISMSTGANLQFGPLAPKQQTLAAEIRAVKDRTVVVAAAGNGEFLFPAQMPSVIAVGGVFVNGEHREASSLASAFTSEIFENRGVPDVCGLVGMRGIDRYIALPVPPKSRMDAIKDGTKSDDGWAFFSGTSSATPQVAGVCALLLETNKEMSPKDVLDRLVATADDIRTGAANPGTNPGQPGGLPAGKDRDPATGAGLVNAARACGL